MVAPKLTLAPSVRRNESAVPLFVSIIEVGVPKPPGRVKAILLPVVVVIVLPLP